MKILALDLATSTGFAVGDTADLSPSSVVSGTILLGSSRGASLGHKLCRLAAELRSLIDTHKPDMIVREEALFRGRAASQHGYGFAAIALMVANERNLPCMSIHNSSVKKATTGSGKAEKPAMVAAVRALGFSPATHDEADAIAILHAAAFNGFQKSAA